MSGFCPNHFDDPDLIDGSCLGCEIDRITRDLNETNGLLRYCQNQCLDHICSRLDAERERDELRARCAQLLAALTQLEADACGDGDGSGWEKARAAIAAAEGKEVE